MLDLGCGDASLTIEVARMFNAFEIYGIDVLLAPLKRAEAKGLKVFKIDLNNSKLLFPENYFDIITAFDVIEHL